MKQIRKKIQIYSSICLERPTFSLSGHFLEAEYLGGQLLGSDFHGEQKKISEDPFGHILLTHIARKYKQ